MDTILPKASGFRQPVAGATKNALSGVMNASAVLLFVTSPEVHWLEVVVLAVWSIAGGHMGAWALHLVNEKMLRVAIVEIGFCFTVGLFVNPI